MFSSRMGRPGRARFHSATFLATVSTASRVKGSGVRWPISMPLLADTLAPAGGDPVPQFLMRLLKPAQVPLPGRGLQGRLHQGETRQDRDDQQDDKKLNVASSALDRHEQLGGTRPG